MTKLDEYLKDPKARIKDFTFHGKKVYAGFVTFHDASVGLKPMLAVEYFGSGDRMKEELEGASQAVFGCDLFQVPFTKLVSCFERFVTKNYPEGTVHKFFTFEIGE